MIIEKVGKQTKS